MSVADTWKRIVEVRRRNPGDLIARILLRLVSLPYGLTMAVRNWFYDAGLFKTERAAVPVICVGNLTLGGTGKTPCVEWLANWCRQRDLQVAILSRGYGAESGPNDEALLLEENLPDVPHLQNRDRVALAKTAVEELESEILILDDGFQHRRLHRDLNIVLFDATQKAVAMFPRGYLRESLSGLRRADLLILTHADRITTSQLEAWKRKFERIKPGLPIAFAKHRAKGWYRLHQSEAPPDHFRNQKAIAFCGLGKPDSFRKSLESLGIEVIDFREFSDHHNYQANDVAELSKWAAGFPEETLILTTQKDFVKLQIAELGNRPLWSLRIELAIFENEIDLYEVLKRVLLPKDVRASIRDQLVPTVGMPYGISQT